MYQNNLNKMAALTMFANEEEADKAIKNNPNLFKMKMNMDIDTIVDVLIWDAYGMLAHDDRIVYHYASELAYTFNMDRSVTRQAIPKLSECVWHVLSSKDVSHKTRTMWIHLLCEGITCSDVKTLKQLINDMKQNSVMEYAARTAISAPNKQRIQVDEWISWIAFYLTLSLTNRCCENDGKLNKNINLVSSKDKQAIFWATECVHNYGTVKHENHETYRALETLMYILTMVISDIIRDVSRSHEVVRIYRALERVSLSNNEDPAHNAKLALASLNDRLELIKQYEENIANEMASSLVEEEHPITTCKVSKSKKHKLRRKAKKQEQMETTNGNVPTVVITDDEMETDDVAETTEKYYRVKKCVMCMNAESSVLFGCKHIVCCSSCTNNLRTAFGGNTSCPFCHHKI